ncbi:MAG: Asp-tRNA(Asn)/Glu-tRNA(Gln) amidotransferase subunit GatC, partial [Clostridiales bacterium]|nr:Asp-tRNA(Asn)/Glu-tRNA(Gln) amidotransferase subunit GatC [Clostridiales bacterium]
MNLQDSQIETLAEAAKIEIKDIDKNRFKKDLDGLISSLEILRELDAENIEPMINVHDYKNVFRDDIVENENYQA